VVLVSLIAIVRSGLDNFDTLASIKPWLLDVAHYNRTLCAAIAAAAEGTKVLAIRAGFF